MFCQHVKTAKSWENKRRIEYIKLICNRKWNKIKPHSLFIQAYIHEIDTVSGLRETSWFRDSGEMAGRGVYWRCDVNGWELWKINKFINMFSLKLNKILNKMFNIHHICYCTRLGELRRVFVMKLSGGCMRTRKRE